MSKLDKTRSSQFWLNPLIDWKLGKLGNADTTDGVEDATAAAAWSGRVYDKEKVHMLVSLAEQMVSPVSTLPVAW